MASGANRYHIGNKTCYILKQEILKDLKASYLLYEWVFYRQEQNSVNGRGRGRGHFEGVELQKWNITLGRTQKVDEEENRLICLFMFSAAFMVIKISKMAHFFVFSADGSIKSVTFWAKYLSTS